jgi:Tol biopolymer transport system component
MPNLASGNWDESDPLNNAPGYNYLGYGILNLGPCPLPGGLVAFSSNRDDQPNKSFTAPCLQLYVMDEDGRNVTRIAPMNMGSALHPTVLQDGRFMFSSHEAQGIRDRRMLRIVLASR